VLREVDIDRRPDTATVRSALRDGFFLVRNSVPQGLLDESYGLLEAFFSLPPRQKEAARVPGSNGQSGYTPPLVETAEKSGGKPDYKELLHWGPLLPEGHPLRARYPARYPVPHLR
jgi:isopenicillin N synthase-like dioxygenase